MLTAFISRRARGHRCHRTFHGYLWPVPLERVSCIIYTHIAPIVIIELTHYRWRRVVRDVSAVGYPQTIFIWIYNHRTLTYFHINHRQRTRTDLHTILNNVNLIKFVLSFLKDINIFNLILLMTLRLLAILKIEIEIKKLNY